MYSVLSELFVVKSKTALDKGLTVCFVTGTIVVFAILLPILCCIEQLL